MDRLDAIARDLARKRPPQNLLCRDEEILAVGPRIRAAGLEGGYRPHAFSPGWTVFRRVGAGG